MYVGLVGNTVEIEIGITLLYYCVPLEILSNLEFPISEGWTCSPLWPVCVAVTRFPLVSFPKNCLGTLARGDPVSAALDHILMTYWAASRSFRQSLFFPVDFRRSRFAERIRTTHILFAIGCSLLAAPSLLFGFRYSLNASRCLFLASPWLDLVSSLPAARSSLLTASCSLSHRFFLVGWVFFSQLPKSRPTLRLVGWKTEYSPKTRVLFQKS